MVFDKFKKSPAGEPATVAPCANIFEQDQSIVLALEMPGADKESLDVSLDGNILKVSGRTKTEDLRPEYQPLYQERRPVGYLRSFELNTPVDRDKISARYENGVLEISLAKAEAARPKKIAIAS